MCGLSGFFKHPATATEMESLVLRMNDQLLHRGPDDGGIWLDPSCGIALGQRRLSIIDLSPAGHQPMHSSCGRYVIVFNGEIYNYQEIRDELEKAGVSPVWRGTSDTEVMLAAFAHWGVSESVRRFNGMFAFVLWDRKNRTLVLARDRMGKKPLYYGFHQGTFMFASELKALQAHSDFKSQIDSQSVAQFLRYSYIPTPYTIFLNTRKLEPASILTLTWNDLQSGRLPLPEKYWNISVVAARQVANPFPGTFQEAQDELERLLLDAVRIRMIADVPLGAFFSGGIDSTLVVALMQAQSSRPVKTFTIGFEDESYDEAKYAAAIAAHLGTQHTELTATSQQVRDVIPLLARMYDEPFADSSQIPTYLVSKLTREHVTVALSGDGGDEVFGGYNRYVYGPKAWKAFSRIPLPVRRRLADSRLLTTENIWKLVGTIKKYLPGFFNHRIPEQKISKLLGILSSRDKIDLYHRLTSLHPNPEGFCNFAVDPDRDPHAHRFIPPGFTFAQAMQLWDMQYYLPDDILVKVDRASMAASLESRAPLLDYRVVEFAWSLPMEWKIREDSGKYILRTILQKYLPQEFWQRPKSGFGVPLERLGFWENDLKMQLGKGDSGISWLTCKSIYKYKTEMPIGFKWILSTLLKFDKSI